MLDITTELQQIHEDISKHSVARINADVVEKHFNRLHCQSLIYPIKFLQRKYYYTINEKGKPLKIKFPDIDQVYMPDGFFITHKILGREFSYWQDIAEKFKKSELDFFNKMTKMIPKKERWTYRTYIGVRLDLSALMGEDEDIVYLTEQLSMVAY